MKLGGMRNFNQGNVGPGLFWYDAIRMRLPFWFGRPFWFHAVLWLIVFPAAQLALIVRWSPGWTFACLLAVIDFLVAGLLFAIAWGLTSFGTHAFTVPVDLLDFLKRACPGEYSTIRYKAEQSRGDLAQSEKVSFLRELVNMPLPFKIFTRYIWRPALVVLAVPLYIAVGMISLDAIPPAHKVNGLEAGAQVFHSLGVIRDLQMGMLGGSSTEHLSGAGSEAQLAEYSLPCGAGGRELVIEGVRTMGLRDPQASDPRSVGSWGSLAWELLGFLCAFLYLGLALILLPLQIGIVSTLDRHLKSYSFWRKQLEVL